MKKDFIPAVGNTHELQTGRSEARDWFMKSAASVKPSVIDGLTAQGFYVLAHDGKAFGFNNNRSVDRVKSFMEKGLSSFRNYTPNQEQVSKSLLESPYGKKPSEATQVVRVYTRIKPVPPGSDPSNENVARDHLWIPKSEIETILTKKEFAPQTIYRIARFSLIDNVRGEPDHWKAADLKTTILTPKVLIEANGQVVYDVSGRFEMATPDQLRGLNVKVQGRMLLERSTAKIKEFRLYAEGSAWGRSTYTPNPPEGVFPIVFAFVETNDAASREVPPQAIFFGNEYFDPKR